MARSEIPIYQVDAFTNEAFSGNPAAVCLLDGPADPEWMQNVGAEMNLSETSFVTKEAGGFALRWFTPEVEVPLCGHATLASAHVLWESGTLPSSRAAVFRTKSGELRAELQGDEIVLDFPAYTPEPVEYPEAVRRALGVEPVNVARVPRQMGEDNVIVELESEDAVRALAPDLDPIRGPGSPGVIVTSRSANAAFDFVSRYFVPWAGIDEDPVTGSAHCALGPYWSERLGKNELRAFQASRRGGVLGVVVAGDRVRLRGRAVTVLKGTLLC